MEDTFNINIHISFVRCVEAGKCNCHIFLLTCIYYDNVHPKCLSWRMVNIKLGT